MRAFLCCTALLFGFLPASAQEAKPSLKPGAELPGPFHPYNVANGKFEGRFHCLVCEHKLNPGVLIFAQDPQINNRADPFPALLKRLDDFIVNDPRTRLRGFAIFLYPDLKDVVTQNNQREERAKALLDLKQAVSLQKVVLALDSTEALRKNGYELDPDAAIVVVLYDKLKVQNVYRYPAGKLTPAAIDAIMKEIGERLAPTEKK